MFFSIHGHVPIQWAMKLISGEEQGNQSVENSFTRSPSSQGEFTENFYKGLVIAPLLADTVSVIYPDCLHFSQAFSFTSICPDCNQHFKNLPVARNGT